MEPPPFGAGNSIAPTVVSGPVVPSMEPPPFGAGNKGEYGYLVEEIHPSMEPPPFGAGNGPRGSDSLQDSPPSMEPPPFGAGNLSPASFDINGVTTFNGATAFRRWKRPLSGATIGGTSVLQWSHRLSALETMPPALVATTASPPSMEPPPFGAGNLLVRRVRAGVTSVLQWSHRLSALETRYPPGFEAHTNSFNGATAFRRWKLGELAAQFLPDRLPSMEPPPFGAGNRPGCGRRSSGNAPFNGATAFRRWKPYIKRYDLSRDTPFNGATAFRRWKHLPRG